MNTRLQQFLELEELTPARLADILGVQRSGMSHILSGRNKPGYDFISKLLTKFPELNADWILIGRGKPYKKSDSYPNPVNPDNPTIPVNQAIAVNHVNSVKVEKEEPQINLFSHVEPETQKNQPFSVLAENTYQSSEKEEITSQNSESQLAENRENEKILHTIGKNRKVKRITLFYDDGSFEEFYR